ncbi:hypothetical protein PRZ48_008786 [Zasmidium cellare]|uniref:Uncharacterized protein n=1 Tax=Zasmidium cellare TaxID=395010 RepID=A0ABR0EGF7_ZASCE|nr:hypothetical protein PRZ48_008786 [Zasmidium cellare]
MNSSFTKVQGPGLRLQVVFGFTQKPTQQLASDKTEGKSLEEGQRGAAVPQPLPSHPVGHTNGASERGFRAVQPRHFVEIDDVVGKDINMVPVVDSLFKDRTGIRAVGDFDVVNQILLTRAYAHSKYDGQLIFIAKIHKQTLETDGERHHADEVPDLVHVLAAGFGEVMAIQLFKYKVGQCSRVEYFAITAGYNTR